MFIKTFVGACIAGAALSLNLLVDEDQTPAAITEILAQTETTAEISSAICLRTANRNKAALPDFYKILGGKAKYTDTDFKASWNTAFAWKEASESFTEIKESKTTWTRASVAFPGKTLWGTKGITPYDMTQGEVGNCWFIAAVSALAETKGRVE